MQEIVTKVLAAEKEADETLRQARAEATNIRNKAETESAAIVDAACEEAQELIRAKVVAAREEAKTTREASIAAAEAEGEQLLAERAPSIEKTISRVITRLTQPEFSQAQKQE
ncbi:MAG: hypothetical protein ACYTGH_18655 [Planctomycetota bacterium]|jgi:vacuolar-type H+-ATPase subunit H